MRQVPVLEVEEGGEKVHLAQSMAILEYLEERYPTPPLLPEDRVLRARSRQLAEIINAGIQPLQNLHVLQKLKEHDVHGTEWASYFVRRGLNAYEAVAKTTAGAFSVGDAPTMADVHPRAAALQHPSLPHRHRVGVPAARAHRGELRRASGVRRRAPRPPAGRAAGGLSAPLPGRHQPRRHQPYDIILGETPWPWSSRSASSASKRSTTTFTTSSGAAASIRECWTSKSSA